MMSIESSGWCPTIKKLADLGYLETNPRSINEMTYRELTKSLISKNDSINLKADVASFLNLPIDHFVINNMEWLGLFSDDKVHLSVNRLRE
jgi:saccharopine dehydrogenase (NADP+, L-glutamate forming)/spermidine synthase